MKRLWISIVICAAVASVAGAEPTKVEQANALNLAGTTAFNAGRFAEAFAKFEQSYNLVPSAATAVRACQAKLNADSAHPSAALDWLRKVQNKPGTTSLDDNGWRAVDRLHDALDQDVRGLEVRIAQLEAENAKLKAKAERSFESLKAFSYSLPAADRERFDAQLKQFDVRTEAAAP